MYAAIKTYTEMEIMMSKKEDGLRIEVKNLNKSFGTLSVLENIDLTMDKGEFVAIVGRSGCGKSTMLRLISGLEKPTSGNIYTGGEEVKGANSDIRFVFQEARLLPWKSVLNNVRIGAPNGDKNIAGNALISVGLEDKAKQWPITLSGGQKQRVALARALAGRPKVLLLDEPLGALDALTRIEMQNLIESLWLEQGFTAVLVTHDVSEAVRLADRVIIMDHHKIALDEKITLARPRERGNDFVYFEQRILKRVMNATNTKIEKASLEYTI